MNTPTRQDVLALVEHADKPCLSIYIPTHRRHPETAEDAIRLRNALAKAQMMLDHKGQRDSMLKGLAELHDDRDFWRHQRSGLAIFRSPTHSAMFRLPVEPRESVTVADSFHVKPMLRATQSSGRVQVLCLARRDVRLYEADEFHLDAVPLHSSVPKDVYDALGVPEGERSLNTGTYGGWSTVAGGQHGAGTVPGVSSISGPASYHGHTSRTDEQDKELPQYLRAVDAAILKHHSRPSGLPLILATLPEYQSAFRDISRNDALLKERIDLHPDALDEARLRKQLEPILGNLMEQEVAEAVANYNAAKAGQHTECELEGVAKMAWEGRVATLMLDRDRQESGRIDAKDGTVRRAVPGEKGVDDLFDDLAERVFRTGGQVLLLPREKMPVSTGLAAVARY